MTVGLKIPGVSTLHPRESWEQSGYKVSGPSQRPGNITQAVAHYPADPTTPDGDFGETAADLVSYIRANQRYYVNKRGYSLGYLWLIDWLGGVWEVRGFDYKSAANGGHNDYTAPLKFIVDGQSAPSAAAWKSARAVWREHRRRSGRSDFVDHAVGHGYLRESTGRGTATSCPGAGVKAGLAAGYGDLDRDVDPPPAPPKPPDGYGLYPFNAAKRTVKAGTDGGDVVYLQRVLRDKASQSIAVDGDFGNQTKGAVVNLQKISSVIADGVVGWDGGDGWKPGPDSTWTIVDLLAGHDWKNSPLTPPAPPKPPPPPSPPTTSVVDLWAVVLPGDGWWSISKRCTGVGTHAAAIEKLNNSAELHPGQTVDIGGKVKPGPDTVLYSTVLDGDGYWALAKRLYVSGSTGDNVAALQEANGNKGLHPGDDIAVPGLAVM